MSENEIGEIRDELKAYKEQLDSLRDDLRIVFQCTANNYAIRSFIQSIRRGILAFKQIFRD